MTYDHQETTCVSSFINYEMSSQVPTKYSDNATSLPGKILG